MKCVSIAAALLVATSLAACSPDTQPAPTAPAESPAAAPAEEAPAAPAAIVEARLEVSPQSFSLCEHPEGLIEADLSWDASAAGTRWVQIFVESPSSERKLWASKPPQGEGRTGRWVRDGSRFTLVDS